MSVTSFNPYDSDSWPDPIDDDNNLNNEINEQTINFGNDSSSSNDEQILINDPNDPNIHITNLENLRVVLSLLSHFPGGILSNHLRNFPGLIILPISAISMIRKPTANHNANPSAFVYFPSDGQTLAPHLNQLNEVVRLLYSNPQ